MKPATRSIDERFAAACAQLVLDRPFLGTLVLRMEFIAAEPDWCTTTACNGRDFFFNPAYITELATPELQFVLAHEALHCALGHFTRRHNRIRHRWDLACDYAINPILVDEGLKPPPDIMIMQEYRGMTAEEIYPMLQDNDHSETMDLHIYGNADAQQQSQGSAQQSPPGKPAGSDGAANDDADGHQQPADPVAAQASAPAQENGNANSANTLSAREMDQQQQLWQQHLVNAAHHARRSGKLSAPLQRFFEQNNSATVPWRALLARYLYNSARNDYSYNRPCNRREGTAILPGLHSPGIRIALAIDVSGSISDEQLGECVAEINALKGQLDARTTLLACDSALVEPGPQQFEPWDEMRLPENIADGGTTDFRPVFEWLDACDQAPDVLVFFTDACGSFPDTAPGYPVLWLVKGNREVPWGTRVQLRQS